MSVAKVMARVRRLPRQTENRSKCLKSVNTVTTARSLSDHWPKSDGMVTEANAEKTTKCPKEHQELGSAQGHHDAHQVPI